MQNQQKKRGGARPGSGRPRGVPDKATTEQRATLEERARGLTDTALEVLERVAKTSQSDAARVAAANSLLDRGYGKPRQGVDHTGPDGGPIQHKHKVEIAFVSANES